MAWKGDLKIYTVTVSIQCNTICPHPPPHPPTPLTSSQLRYSPSFNQNKSIFYSTCISSFPWKSLPSAKKPLHNQKMDPYRYNGEKYFSFRIGIFFIIPYYNVAQNSLKYWYSVYKLNAEQKCSFWIETKSDRKIVHIIIINFSSILLA